MSVFRGFHCCPDGEVGNKGFPRLISHLKRLHLSSDERKGVLREAISTGHGLYMAVEETLKVLNQWLCGKCMDLHVVSRACHHPDGKDDGITTLVKSILDGSALGSFGQCGGDFLEEEATGNTNIKQCLCKVANGYFTAVVKVLSSSSVAPYYDDTIKALEAKHPYKPLPSMPSITFFEPPLVVEIDSVFSCIKSFPKGTSCGRDGLRAQHILDALCGEGSATTTDLLKSLLLLRSCPRLKIGRAAWRILKEDGFWCFILKFMKLFTFGQGGGDFLEEGATGNTNIKQCLRKVADGHFTATVKVLSSSSVALYCDDTIKALKAKHPYKPPPSMPSITFSEPPLVAEIDSVFSCIKSFPKSTSCGRDGLRAQHILDALCGEGYATATDLLKVITSVVNLWLAGRCPPILAEFVAFAPLMPLLKPDSEILSH
ncbi:hypothetical protein Tco_0746796 [Tanacetum coccineum]